MAVFNQDAIKTKTNYKNTDGTFITTIPITTAPAVVVNDGDVPEYLDEKLRDIESKLTPDAEPNQLAFSTLSINSNKTNLIEAVSKTCNLNLIAGSNITLTPGTGDECEITIAAKDTTYGTATETEAGLMSPAEKIKLSGIAENANNYTHPTSGVTAGTYRSVKVDVNGHVTEGSNPTTLSGYGITDVYVDNDKFQIKLGNDTFSFGDILRTSSSLDASKLTGTLSLNAPTATKATNDSNGNNIINTYATKTELNNVLAANDAMIFKGTIGTGGTVTALPTTHNAGWAYKVITANSYANIACEVGDLIICTTDGTSANDNHWTVVQTNIDGAVTGPTSSTGDRIAVFNGASGKIIKDGGKTISELTSSIDSKLPLSGGTMTGALTLSGAPTSNLHAATKKYVDDSKPTKTSQLTNDSGFITTSDIPEGAAASTTTPKMDGTATVGTEKAFARGDHVHPTDTSRAASTHGHGNITNAGTITASSITPANGDYIIITDSSDSNKINKGISISTDTTKFLRNDGTWAVPPDTKYTHPTYSEQSSGLYKISVDETGHVNGVIKVIKSDITALGIPSADTTYSTFTSSTSGLVPAGGSGDTKFLRQDGTWVVPPDTDTVYTHPTYTGRTNGLYKVTVDNTGHVSEVNTVTKSDITALGIPSADTTYSTFTSSASGLVPAGGSGTTKFLRQDGTWVVPTDTIYTHPNINATNTSGTATPAHGETFDVIESVTVNTNGHVTGYKTTTITLPEGVDSNYVTNAISNITHPVTSVNNQTGSVELTASDVGAAGANDTAIIRTWSSLTGGAN